MSNPSQHKNLSEFFHFERKRLIRYVQRRIEDTAARDSEDIVHDVALNLFNRADVTTPIENISAYVYQSLRNRIVDLLRKRKTKLISMERAVHDHPNVSLADLIYDYRYNPELQMDRKQLRDKMFNAIAALDDKEKAIIIETEFEGRSYAEISGQWGIPVGTLLSRKSRALKKIRETLKSDKDEFQEE